MVANKRLRTESFPTSELPLEPQAKPRTPGTIRIFSLVPELQNPKDSISIIYPAIPHAGWHLEEEVFKIDSRKEVCHHFALSKEVPVVGTSQVRDSVFGSSLKVIGPDAKTRADCLRFAFSLSKGNDTFMLPPAVYVWLELVTGSGYKCDIQLNLTHGVGLPPNAVGPWDIIDQYFVYHGVVGKTNYQWTPELSEFLWSGSEGELPTVQIKGAKVTAILHSLVIRKAFELDSKTVLTPFTLIDSGKNRHPCHKEVLIDQCRYFRKALEENPSMTEMDLGIWARCSRYTVIDLLLHHLYHPQKPLPPIPNFEVAFELMILAAELELIALVKIGVNNLIQKMNLATSIQLLKAYFSINPRQLKFQIQIFFNMWKALVIKIKSRILEEDDGKTECFDKSYSFLNLSAFTSNGYFRYELLEDLTRDLNRWEGETGEETAQQLKVQSVLNRFKGEVIKRMGSKLKTNKIQL